MGISDYVFFLATIKLHLQYIVFYNIKGSQNTFKKWKARFPIKLILTVRHKLILTVMYKTGTNAS